jgi:hypothetical protein
MSTECIRPIEQPGFLLSGAYAIGRRIFGDVPTPQKVMAHHPALMLGIGALRTAAAGLRGLAHGAGRQSRAGRERRVECD